MNNGTGDINLGNQINYFMNSGCDANTGVCVPMQGITVNITIRKEVVSNIGLSFQLNALTPKTSTNCGWQQFGYNVTGTGASTIVKYFINNWNQTGPFLIHFDTIPGLPSLSGSDPTSGPSLPAGYQFGISLANDADDNISGVTFTVTDNGGKAYSTELIGLIGLGLTNPTPPQTTVTQANLAPISTFQLLVVGVAERQSYLSGGEGTIAYSSTTPLNVLSKRPDPCVSATTGTFESANTVYGQLAEVTHTPGEVVVQTFGYAGPPPYYEPGGRFAVSQQCGLNFTNLFAVNVAGQLVQYSVYPEGRWTSQPIGPSGLFRTKATVATVNQIGQPGRTSVFGPSQDGKLFWFWSEIFGYWNGPTAIGDGPTGDNHPIDREANLVASPNFGSLQNEVDLMFIDKNGALNVLSALGTGSWSSLPLVIPLTMPVSKGAPLAVTQNYANSAQTDLFFVDKTGALNVISAQGFAGWTSPLPPVTIAPAKTFPDGAYVAASMPAHPGQTSVCAVDTNGQVNVFSAVGTAAWSSNITPDKLGTVGQFVPGAPVALAFIQFDSPNAPNKIAFDVLLMDKQGQLNWFQFIQGTGWNTGSIVGPPGIAPTQQLSPNGAFVVASPEFGVPGKTDVFVINENGKNGPGWPMVYWYLNAAEGPTDPTAPSVGWYGPKSLVVEV